MCRLALLEVRGTSRSGYSNCKQCGNDDDHHHYDHDGDDYNHPDLDDHNEMMMTVLVMIFHNLEMLLIEIVEE